MAALKNLISISELKTGHLKRMAGSGAAQAFLNYDPDFDALMILFVSPDTPTAVHYVDDHVALLVTPDTYEIVGLQVEDFESSFMPAHASVKQAWQLSKAAGEHLQDYGDILLAVEERQSRMVREIVKAAPELPDELLAAVA